MIQLERARFRHADVGGLILAQDRQLRALSHARQIVTSPVM
jgi:hypothetical protein